MLKLWTMLSAFLSERQSLMEALPGNPSPMPASSTASSFTDTRTTRSTEDSGDQLVGGEGTVPAVSRSDSEASLFSAGRK